MELKKRILDKIVRDRRSLSYLAREEIAVLSLMSALAEIDEFFRHVFKPVIFNTLEFKKSLDGFAITVVENMLNPYKVYIPHKAESIVENHTKMEKVKSFFKSLK